MWWALSTTSTPDSRSSQRDYNCTYNIQYSALSTFLSVARCWLWCDIWIASRRIVFIRMAAELCLSRSQTRRPYLILGQCRASRGLRPSCACEKTSSPKEEPCTALQREGRRSPTFPFHFSPVARVAAAASLISHLPAESLYFTRGLFGCTRAGPVFS